LIFSSKLLILYKYFWNCFLLCAKFKRSIWFSSTAKCLSMKFFISWTNWIFYNSFYNILVVRSWLLLIFTFFVLDLEFEKHIRQKTFNCQPFWLLQTVSNGHTFNQIDHCLIDGRHFSNVIVLMARRGANIYSDHMLVTYKTESKNIPYQQHKVTITETFRSRQPEG
jgi:hypothetical protein